MNVRTATEMYDSFHDGVNKEQNGSLSPAEWERQINEAQILYVTKRYDEFERTQKRIDDLRSIKRNEVILPTAVNTFDFQQNITTPGSLPLVNYAPVVEGRNGYLFLLKLKVLFNYQGNPCYTNGLQAVPKYITTKPMKADMDLENDYYNRPTDERPYHEFSGSDASGTILTIITNTASTVDRAKIEFLAHPRTIRLANNNPQDIDLPLHARAEVVEMAVTQFLERIESQRVKTHVAIQNMIPK